MFDCGREEHGGGRSFSHEALSTRCGLRSSHHAGRSTGTAQGSGRSLSATRDPAHCHRIGGAGNAILSEGKSQYKPEG